MQVCCVELNIAARLIGFYGLVIGAIVMVEMSAEMGHVQCSIGIIRASMEGHDVLIEETSSGGAAVSALLLGLSLEEFGARERHKMHPAREMPPHVHIVGVDPPQLRLHKLPSVSLERNQTQDLFAMEAENQIYIGFLLFAILYAFSSALLIFGSIAEIQWTAVPWLVAHLGTVSAQTAGLVVQVTATMAVAPVNDHLAPGHPDEAHANDEDNKGSSAPGALILSILNMMLLVYMWLVVMVTMRSWKKGTNLKMSTRAALGDESYALSTLASSTYSPYSSNCSHKQ